MVGVLLLIDVSLLSGWFIFNPMRVVKEYLHSEVRKTKKQEEKNMSWRDFCFFKTYQAHSSVMMNNQYLIQNIYFTPHLPVSCRYTLGSNPSLRTGKVLGLCPPPWPSLWGHYPTPFKIYHFSSLYRKYLFTDILNCIWYISCTLHNV